MSGSKKIWVIDVEAELDSIFPRKKRHSSKRADRKVSLSPHSQSPGSRARDSQQPRERTNFAALLSLTYLLGPFAILLIPRGRRSKFWVITALASGLSGAVILWHWQNMLAWIEDGFPIQLWFFFTFFVILTGFTVWARAVRCAGGDNTIVTQNLPWLLRKPWAIGILGLLFPGLGLLLAGRPKRAALAIWMFGPMVMSALVIAHTMWLWKWHQNAGSAVISGNNLEYVLMVTVLFAALGILAWIGQALDGARWMSLKLASSRRARGDWVAAALLVAIVAYVTVSEPTSVAKQFDRFAGTMRQEGFRVIPLCLMHTAIWLDPSQPVYVIQASELYEELGRQDTATRLRDKLVESWKPYVAMLQREGLWDLRVPSLDQPSDNRFSSSGKTENWRPPEWIVGPYQTDMKDHASQDQASRPP